MAEVRIVFFADTHLGFDFPVKPRVERRRRGPDFFDNFYRVLDYARQTRPDFLLHGGDVFFRARVPQRVVDKVYSALFDFAGEGIPILIVPGNHERSILPASLFLGHPNIHIFDHPKTFTFDVNESRLAFSGFPCRCKDVRAQFATLLQDSGWSQFDSACQLLCLHQTVEGAKVGPSGYTFRRGEDVIPRADLPAEAVAVLSGHIHREQVLASRTINANFSPPVIYPGSIERTSFAERDERKGFYDIKLAQQANGKWGIEELDFQRLPARPMVDLTLEKCLAPSGVPDFIRAESQKLDPDSIVRLRCERGIDPAVKRVVTSRLLRDLLPETMNYQFSSDFRQWKTG
jgi:DNA repair exonuclease SbcCD nuclease subunit